MGFRFCRRNIFWSRIVLTLQKANGVKIITLPTDEKSIEDLLTKEWLLTNGRGSYASSTIVGCNTRRYHGLLVGSLNPPANRIMALANCLEMVILGGKVFNLSTFEFSEKFAPEGFGYIKQFRRDTGVHFDYELNKLELTKSIYLLRDTDTVGLVYDFRRVEEPTEFALRPFVGLRDFHTLQKSYAPLCSTKLSDGLFVCHNVPGGCKLSLRCSSMSFEKDQQWWFNFVYRNDKQRGQDFTEDLWTPGFFKCRVDSPTTIVLWANLSSCAMRDSYWEQRNPQYDIETVREDLHGYEEDVKRKAKSAIRYTLNAKRYLTLLLAADQFIATRDAGDEPGEASCELRTPSEPQRKKSTPGRTTILAGFPWFADWGRDAFMALQGLLLSTGRFEEAKSVLTTFAQAADKGMIPNRFDDRSGTAYFNSIDASLWFINAAFQYLSATGDSETFTQNLLPVICQIIDSYHNGTRFGIRADVDGLITAGNEETQLTWMDAKYDGVALTPRCGKAVEVNVLWYNSLCWLAQFYANQDTEAAKHYHSMANKVKKAFRQFWNETTGYLNDCIAPDGSIDASLRPNQIFAVSLSFSPLPPQQQKSVVDAVQKGLLTPYGLRTLNAQDSRYKSTYTGPQQQRDEAYHQGTVWPYLIRPFVEAYLKVNDFSRKSKKKSAEFIEPLMQHLTEDGCLGQICEIFDGDAPHKPRGCIAQAWSVAELIRAYQLVNS